MLLRLRPAVLAAMGLAMLFAPLPASAQQARPAQAQPAQTQPAPPTDGADIVVTGVRTTDQELDAFVDALTVAPGTRQLSRFRLAVCPAVAGVPAAQKLAVADRLRAVARAAGIDVGVPKCRPNVLVIVSADRRALMRTIFERRPAYINELPREERRRVLESTEPAVAWHIRGAPLTADGTEIPVDMGSGVAINRSTRNPSRITSPTRPHFAAAIVVIDAAALAGLTTTQLADYAAMRTFIRTDPKGVAGSAEPTILKVLDAPMGGEIPLTLTRWDLGVLRGLYASNPNLTAAAQRSAIRGELADDLKNPDRRQR